MVCPIAVMKQVSTSPGRIRGRGSVRLLQGAHRGLCIGVAIGIMSCGGPSNLDICRTQCVAKRRCVPGFTAEQETTCRRDCDGMPGSLNDRDNEENQMCRNAAELRKQKLECYSLGCMEIDACVQPLVAITASNPKCVKN